MRLHPGDRISWRDEEHLVVTVHTGCVALRSKVDGEDIEVLSADFSGAGPNLLEGLRRWTPC